MENEIRNLEDFNKLSNTQFDFYYGVIGESMNITREDCFIKWQKSNETKFNTLIKPQIDLIGKTVGQDNSLFNKHRKITNVAFYLGSVKVFFKEKGQRLERYQDLTTLL